MDDIQELFKDTIAEFMENGLKAELDDQLGYSRYEYKNKDTDNSRNGHSSKTLRTSFGDVEVSVPRDRKSEFEPKVLRKNHTSISQDIEDIFIACTDNLTGFLRRSRRSIPRRKSRTASSISFEIPANMSPTRI